MFKLRDVSCLNRSRRRSLIALSHSARICFDAARARALQVTVAGGHWTLDLKCKNAIYPSNNFLR